MAIKQINKDRRQAVIEATPEVVLAWADATPTHEHPLVFWTRHENATEVDLRVFETGETWNASPSWAGTYTGRPQLIRELLPHLEAQLISVVPGTVKAYFNSLRAWWRLFDALEQQARELDGSKAGEAFAQVHVRGVADLGVVHQSKAYQLGMVRDNFLYFAGLADRARAGLGLPPLTWVAPQAADPIRSLPRPEHANQIKAAIKNEWRGVIAAWEQAELVVGEARRRLAGEEAQIMAAQAEDLIQHAVHFLQAQARTGCDGPDSTALRGGIAQNKFTEVTNLRLTTMKALFAPTVEEADIAFHLCTLGSAWNPSTVGRLDATDPSLVRIHPKQERYWVLQRLKDESDGEDDEEGEISADKPRAGGRTQYCRSQMKNACSPPAIVKRYLKRTEILRKGLQRQLKEASIALSQMAAAGSDTKAYRDQFMEVQRLSSGVRSVWLYCDRFGKTLWLDGERGGQYEELIDGKRRTRTYLQLLVKRLNEDKPRQGQELIPDVVKSDFRDMFAHWLYQQSGSLVLLSKVLRHRSLKTTQRYVDNTLVSEEIDQKFLTLQGVLIDQLRQGRVDLTILSQLAQHGPMTEEMHTKLREYRALLKTRTQVRCQSPRKPPIHIQPQHKEGQFCSVQRCLLECPNARFLPESLEGIAMRFEELLVIQERLSLDAWTRGRFGDELEYTEALLENLYLPEDVARARQKWRDKIQSGGHLLPDLNQLITQGAS